MTTFVGIDGIRGGWVAVSLSGDGSQRFAWAKSAAQLLSGRYERAVIEMPIGLPERGYRQCDIEARAVVGPRVFLGARLGVGREERIELLEAKGVGKARRWLEQRRGTGIGRDDLIDACACALAARDSTDTVPVRGAQTSGMQAEIWY